MAALPHDNALDPQFCRRFKNARAMRPEISLSPVYMAMLLLSQPGVEGMVQFTPAACIMVAV